MIFIDIPHLLLSPCLLAGWLLRQCANVRQVPDERLETLATLAKSEKIIHEAKGWGPKRPSGLWRFYDHGGKKPSGYD